MSIILARLNELGLKLPDPATPVAAYVPFVIIGNLVFISGQLPRVEGKLSAVGCVGAKVDLAAAKKAAEHCALNIIAHLNVSVGGDLERVERCVKLGGFVASAPDFYDHPKVMNGASELMEKIFGDRGKHTRFAVGVANLPMNATVEVEAVFSILGA